MADPATEAQDEQGLHDLVTMFTRSLMHENTTIPMSAAAKLAQFISELYVLWREEKPVSAPQAALRQMFAEAVARSAQPAPDVTDVAAQNAEPAAADPEPRLRPLTKRGKPRMTPEEIAARRKAIWTSEKRAEHRRRTLERMARERQHPRIVQSIPA